VLGQDAIQQQIDELRKELDDLKTLRANVSEAKATLESQIKAAGATPATESGTLFGLPWYIPVGVGGALAFMFFRRR